MLLKGIMGIDVYSRGVVQFEAGPPRPVAQERCKIYVENQRYQCKCVMLLIWDCVFRARM